jgi:hypothetical protein
MRRTHTCPKCQCDRILHLARIDQQVDPYGRIEPWHIARVPQPIEGFPLPGGEPVVAGQIQAYICRACGFTELYTRDPEGIPVDGTLVRELVGGSDRSGPYR